jgi:YD repeat-containing protein
LVKEDSEYHTTEYKYDDKGNLLEMVMNSDGGKQTQKLTYDENGNVTKMVHRCEDLFSGEEEQMTIRYIYDEKGNLIERITKSNEGKEVIKLYYNDEGVKIAEKMAHDSYFEITEFANDENLTERRYHCKAKDVKTFLETDDFKKQLFETKEIRREQKTEGDKIFEISRFIANDTLQSKEIIITDATTGRILKYYVVEDCFCDNPTVTEKTIEYWD